MFIRSSIAPCLSVYKKLRFFLFSTTNRRNSISTTGCVFSSILGLMAHLRMTESSALKLPCSLCTDHDGRCGTPSPFIELQHFSLKSACVREFGNRDVGTRVFVCNVPSPVCNLYLTFKTETHTHEGLPHTLEHLVFLGSRHFPFKGFLDLVANRCLAQGTNAWTATDNTTYTLTTAGSEGLLNLLPIYLDHLMLPTLSGSAFLTEVHHFTEDGGSAGVVFSEMEACERSAANTLTRDLSRLLYPGDSGYKYETGGMMKWIARTSNKRVIEYHKLFYRWDNLSVIVVGSVDAHKVLDALQSAVNRIESVKSKPHLMNETIFPPQLPFVSLEEPDEFRKPLAFTETAWTDQCNVAPLELSERSVVRFPADDEGTGRVAVAWRGPNWEEFEEREALDILGNYLSESNVAVLERELVQSANPQCASVDFSTENFKSTSIVIEAGDIRLIPEGDSITDESPVDRGVKVAESIHSLLSKEAMKPIDMRRIHVLLKRELLQYYQVLEMKPHETLASLIIEYAVNGRKVEDLRAYVDLGFTIRSLIKKDCTYWQTLMKRQFVDKPNVEIVCLPSKSLVKELQQKDAAQRKHIRDNLGKDYLHEIATYVENVKEQQGRPPPMELLHSVPVASIEKVHLMSIHPITNFGNISQGMPGFQEYHPKPAVSASWTDKLTKLPFFVQINDQPSEFVQLRAVTRVPQIEATAENAEFNIHHLLLLLCDLLFECDVLVPKGSAGNLSGMNKVGNRSISRDDGMIRLSHDQFTEYLQEHTTSYGAGVGIDCSSSPGACTSFMYNLIGVNISCSVDSYASAVTLMQAALRCVDFEESRVEVHIKRHLKQLQRKKRSAKYLVAQLERNIRFDQASILNTLGWGQQYRTLTALRKNLPDAVRLLKELYIQLFKAPNMILNIIGDISKLPSDWVEGWGSIPNTVDANFEKQIERKDCKNIVGFLNLPGQVEFDALWSKRTGGNRSTSNEFGRRVACGIGSSDAAYLRLTVDAPRGYTHNDLAGLMVLTECCSMMEGLLFRAIRGAGYAYGCDLCYDPWIGQMTLCISPATDPVGAVRAALREISAYSLGSSSFTEEEVEAAKCSTLFSIVSREETSSDQAFQSFIMSLKGVGSDFNRLLLHRVAKVNTDEVKRLAKQYLAKFVDAFGNGDGNVQSVSSPASTLCLVTNKSKVDDVVKSFVDAGIGGSEGIRTYSSRALLSIMSASDSDTWGPSDEDENASDRSALNSSETDSCSSCDDLPAADEDS